MSYNAKLIKILQYVVMIALTLSFIFLKNYDYMTVVWICYGIFVCVEIYKIIYLIKNDLNKKVFIEIGKIGVLGIFLILFNFIIHHSPNL